MSPKVDTPKSKKRAPPISFEEAVDMLRLREQGYDIDEIASKFNRHPVTVTKKIAELRKALRKFNEEHGVIQNHNLPATSPATGGGSGINLMELVPKSNPLESITDTAMLGKAAFGAAVIPGSAFHLIAKGFTDESIPIEKRLELAGRGAQVAISFAMGLSEVLKSLGGGVKNNQQRRPEPREIDDHQGGGSGF